MSAGVDNVMLTCPLGHRCQYIEDNVQHRCAWYTHLAGKDPQTGQDIDRWDCAITLMPLVTIENAQTNRGQTQALESFRNEVVKGNNLFLSLATAAAEEKRLAHENNS